MSSSRAQEYITYNKRKTDHLRMHLRPSSWSAWAAKRQSFSHQFELCSSDDWLYCSAMAINGLDV
jgi:hypothetical protein